MPAARPSALVRAVAPRILSVAVAAFTATAALSTVVPATEAAATEVSTLTIGPGSQTLDPGTSFPVRVRLVAGDHALPGRDVTIYWRPGSQYPWRYWHYVVTDSTGYAELPYTADQTMQFTARFTGEDGYTSAGSGNPTYAVRDFGEQLVREASRYYGAPYQYGAAGPTRFDCSGFTMFLARKFGIALSHNAAAQYGEMRHVPRGEQQVGDFIFTDQGGGISHVGIYAGDGKMWAATHTGDVVRLQALYTASYYVGRLR